MNIVFACGSGGPQYTWDDRSAEMGIGGSEECLILQARALAQRGHNVTVYNNCANDWHGHVWKYGEGAVQYFHYSDYNEHMETLNPSLLIAWRDWILLLNKKAGRRWLWCHDIPVGCHCPCAEEIERGDSAFHHIDTFVLLNDYHRSIYTVVPDEKAFVCPIGVDQSPYAVTVERDPSRVLYFSHPNRGLDRLREVWPQVKAAVPSATLASFWWEPEHFRHEDEGLGILPMRKLGYLEVAIETMKAGVFGYPCVFAPEISPATTIKAQMGGCYPVVVKQGGMRDTVKFGLEATQETFARELIEALDMSINGDLDDAREEMSAWAKSVYSWSSVAEAWDNRYQLETNTNG